MLPESHSSASGRTTLLGVDVLGLKKRGQGLHSWNRFYPSVSTHVMDVDKFTMTPLEILMSWKKNYDPLETLMSWRKKYDLFGNTHVHIHILLFFCPQNCRTYILVYVKIKKGISKWVLKYR